MNMMIRLKRLTLGWSILLFSLFIVVQEGYAKIPEPDNIIYGTAREDAVTTSLEIGGVTIASYTQGDNPDAGNYYILRVPIDSLEPQEPDSARPGDTGYIYINGGTEPVATVTIGERGTIQILHLSVMDSDNDGVIDRLEKCPNTPPGEMADEHGCSSSQDGDGDGFTNGVEMAMAMGGSDPYNPDSKPEASMLYLFRGYNQVNFPAETMYYGDIQNLLNALGGNVLIERVEVFEKDYQQYTEAGYNDGGEFYGDNRTLPPGQGLAGLIIYAHSDAVIGLTSKFCHTWDLKAGANLVGSGCIPDGMTAYNLLENIGLGNVISIQRFNPHTGRIETAGIMNGQLIGVNFLIAPGEGYLVNMRQGMIYRP